MDTEQKLVNLTKENFDEAISKGVWLVDFWATWCAPCLRQGKLIDDHLQELTENGATIGKVNVENEPELAVRYKIEYVPTLLLFKDGELIQTFDGIQTIATLKNFL